MIHLAYPNVRRGEFAGCGRYLSLPTDAAPDGYIVARPDMQHWGAVRETALTLAPELKRLGDHCQVYEYRDRTEAYRGDSQDLAYLLALIRCARPLRCETLDGVGDVWCTGVVQGAGWHATLAGVDKSDFETKLRAFFAQSHDRLFVVPAFNVLPEHLQQCATQQVLVHTLADFRAALAASRVAGQWSRKSLLRVDGGELRALVTTLVRTPFHRRVLQRWKEAAILGALLVLATLGSLAWPTLFKMSPPLHTQEILAVLRDELQQGLQALATQIEWTRHTRPDVPNIPQYPGEQKATFEDRARNEFARWIEYVITGYQQFPLPNAVYAAQRAQLPTFSAADRAAVGNAYAAAEEAGRRVALYRNMLYQLLQDLPLDNDGRKRQAESLRLDTVHALTVAWFDVFGAWLLVHPHEGMVQVVHTVMLPTVLPDHAPLPSFVPGKPGWQQTRQQVAQLQQDKVQRLQQILQDSPSQTRPESGSGCTEEPSTAIDAVGKAGLAYMEGNPHDTQCLLQQALQFETLAAAQRHYIEMSLAFLVQPERFDGVKGAYIIDLEPDGTAARYGLQKGDVLLRYHNQPIAELEALARMIPTLHGAPAVAVDFIRQNERLTRYVPGGASLAITASPLVVPFASTL